MDESCSFQWWLFCKPCHSRSNTGPVLDTGDMDLAALMTSDEAQPVTPGKMSHRQGKEGHPIQTKELLQPSALSPGVSCSIGYGASMMKEEGVLRRRFSTCAGVTAVFSPRTDGRKLVRNASFGGYNELSPVLSGFDRGKDDVLQPKEDSTLSMSKSKSESKLYNGSDKEVSSTESKLTKKESLKVQKKNYREEKKRATKELLSTITDPSVIVMADWLKIRGTLKSWTKLWCVLIYKTLKNGQWVGTVLLNACELIERPSKKDGFCFKLFHPLEQSIWAVKGPKGETVGSITQPLPSSYLIFRAASESDGRCWLDALELALKCSSLLKRTMIREGKELEVGSSGEHSQVNLYSLLRASNLQGPDSFNFNDSEIETQHFRDHDLYSDKSDRENEQDHEESDNDGLEKSEESDTDTSERQDDSYLEPEPIEVLRETTYLEQSREELGEAGEASQTETVSEENKSLIWTLLKQVRPGMDLSKVVLPTFILEPRSFLDKLSDYYYHADFLSEAAVEENAYNRLKKVVKWYLSGFYKKPQGLKKPYNPILGETFRCLWIHPQTSSKTFYISEQVSHHPPVSAFYVSNRKDGFCLSGSILAKSKFYGNSLSAILDGEARLTFLNRGEDYVMNMPYAHCKGILYGTLTLELGGQINIMCEKTGYSALLEFKLKPFLGNNDSVNQISGKIKLGKEVLATLEGHWDSEVIIHDKKTGISDTFWNPTPELRQSRLMRCTVVTEEQEDWESEKLWQHVTQAIHNKDQMEATNEKYILEEAQRKATRERKAKCEEWKCRLFEQDPITGEWQYRYADTRPWDPLNDMVQFEKEGWIQTKVRHRTPMKPSRSLFLKESASKLISQEVWRVDAPPPNLINVTLRAVKVRKPLPLFPMRINNPACPRLMEQGSPGHKIKHSSRLRKKGADLNELQSAIDSIKHTQEEINR
ncbi:Oxysterol-binding protein-related protein 8 [Acipenser ruthenus]|uniref:Oxysterol-binding protein n=1 Tax=Acipenser ruthenus TaxID=7906 RepID=A0A444U1U3_ACIRT|nr:Oxysterol-binding protein-related protein 8 [Acipenser ruthenus]